MSQATSKTLYEQVPHPHVPRDPNEVHRSERQAKAAQSRIRTFNERTAVWLTIHTGTMWCAYVFAGIGVGSLVGVFTNNVTLALLFGAISSYFLQLVFLPVLQNGSNVLSRHAEIQAEEMYKNVLRILHDMGQAQAHLNAQDAELLRQTNLLMQLATGHAPSPPGVSVHDTSTTNAAAAAAAASARVDVPPAAKPPATSAKPARPTPAPSPRPRRTSANAKKPPTPSPALTPQQRRSDPPDPDMNDS